MTNHTQVKNVGHISEFPQIWSTTDIIFCHLRPFFTLLPHYWPWNLKFGKNVKNTWRHYPFTHVYHKSRSYAYDVWFLRYKVKWTEFFVILSHFLPFNPLNNPKNQDFEKIKKAWRYYHFTLVYQMPIIWCMIPEILTWQTEFFLILGYFLPFYPSNNPEI